MSKFDDEDLKAVIARELAETDDKELKLSAAERGNVSIIVIDHNAHDVSIFRSGLGTLGFHSIHTIHDHRRALALIEEQKFSHVIFSTEATSISAAEFLETLFGLNGTFIAIPASHNPDIHEVFRLLLLGAKGYLSKPFSIDSLDKAITTATKLPAIPRSVLQAQDRNSAFAAIVLGDLDRFARAYRQSAKHDSAKNELPFLRARLRHSVEMAKSYCGESFLDSFVNATVELAEGPATHLGRLRKKLLQARDDTKE